MSGSTLHPLDMSCPPFAEERDKRSVFHRPTNYQGLLLPVESLSFASVSYLSKMLTKTACKQQSFHWKFGRSSYPSLTSLHPATPIPSIARTDTVGSAGIIKHLFVMSRSLCWVPVHSFWLTHVHHGEECIFRSIPLTTLYSATPIISGTGPADMSKSVGCPLVLCISCVSTPRSINTPRFYTLW